MNKYLIPALYSLACVVLLVGALIISTNNNKKENIKASVITTDIAIEDIIIEKDTLHGKYMPEWVEIIEIQKQLKRQGIYESADNLDTMKKILQKYNVNSYRVIEKKSGKDDVVKTKNLSVINSPIAKD